MNLSCLAEYVRKYSKINYRLQTKITNANETEKPDCLRALTGSPKLMHACMNIRTSMQTE